MINNKLYILDFDNNWSEQIYEIKLDWKFENIVDYEWDIYSGWVGYIIVDIEKNKKIYRNTYIRNLEDNRIIFNINESKILNKNELS